jgi:hypothetical protein
MAEMVLRGVGVLLVLTLGSGIAAANRADDFKFASDKSGCRSIPYDTRGECIMRQHDQESACREITCSRSDYDHKREQYKVKKSDLDNARRKTNDAAVRELERQLKELEVALKKQQADARKRDTAAQTCSDDHQHLKMIFENARSSIHREHDAAIKPYVDHLATQYTNEAAKESKAVNTAKSASEQCSYIKGTSW